MQTDETMDRLVLIQAIADGGAIPRDASLALETLQNLGYGDNTAGCIYRAIVEAAARERAGESRWRKLACRKPG